MEPLIWLFIFFLSGPAPYGESSNVETVTCFYVKSCQLYEKQQLYHQKYLSQHISYYSNATSTFQLQLLISGDINPNPGPQNENDSKPASTYLTPISYDRDELLKLNCAPLSVTSHALHDSVLDQIRSLSFLQKQFKHHRTRRGKKGGCRRLKHLLKVTSLTAPPTDTDTSTPSVNFALWNAISIKKKVPIICEFVLTHEIDILCITETWLNGDHRDDQPIADLTSTLPNFDIHHIPRE